MSSRSESGICYEFTAGQFSELRLPLLRGAYSPSYHQICTNVVFNNLDPLLREQHTGNVTLCIDNNRYLVKCREVFSVMCSTRTVSLADYLEEKVTCILEP